ncbi:MAG TPA: chemotaxis protein [Xanthomonadaceae bacterium]|jgi:chemotaxis protein CheZ|nr:chemotaxis protein [Xanthomonadaceae bacterium]
MNAAAHNAGIAGHLRAALAAIGHADEATLKAELAAIVQWQEAPLMAGLAKLSQQLGEALRELPAVDASVGELPDACTRLDHVVAMTEQATHRTLDLVEASQALLERLAAPAADHDALLRELRGHLSEMALAQSYQDLSGQIIRKVAGIVRGVHDQLTAIGLPPDAAPRADADPRTPSGPAVAGVDRPAASQQDADDLLSHLGL